MAIRRHLSSDETRKLLDVIDNPRDLMITVLALDTGCRINEILAARVDEIDFEAGFLRLPAGRTKGRAERDVPISSGVLQMLRDWTEGRVGGDWLFEGNLGQHYTVRAYEIALDKYGVKAGIQRSWPGAQRKGSCKPYTRKFLTPHTLRRTHAARAAEAGIPINYIQAALGHKNVATTSRYFEVDGDEVKEKYLEMRFSPVGV